MLRQILCGLTIIFSISVFAAEENYLTLRPDIQRGDLEKPQGLWPLMGLGLGAMDHNGSSRTAGVPSHLKVLGSYYFTTPWVADVGLGLHNEILTQSGPGSGTIQSLYSEVAGRYVFSNRWQLGAIWNTLVDNPRRYQSNDGNLASFVGAQALKEFALDDEYLLRVGGRAMTSVGLNGGPVNTIMAELEISFGGDVGKTPLASTVTTKPSDGLIAPTALAPQLDDLAMRSLVPDSKLPHFKSHSAKLTKASEAYYTNLVRILAENQQLFGRVEVVSSAGLAKKRAGTIKGKLEAAGVPVVQINRAEGRQEGVQLQFRGVRDQVILKNLIDSVTR